MSRFLPCLSVLGLLVVMTMPLSALAQHEVDHPDRIRVAFINPGYGDRGFWKDVRDTMQAAADQFGYDLIVFDSDRDWQKMANSAAEAFALDPAPDFIIAVNEHQQGTRIVLEAERRGIPVIMLLNDLTQEQKDAYGRPRKDIKNWILTLTPDNERAGYDIATSLIDGARLANADKLPKKMCLLSIAGDRKTPASLERLDGLDHALSKFPILEEQRRLVANWSYDEAYRQTEAWLKRGGCVDAVWAANDNIALGAIAALKDAGRVPGKDVFVGGLNWSKDGLDAVAQGAMTLTHGGHFFAGAWVMVLLHDYISGVEILKENPEVTFRMEAVTQENLSGLGDVLSTREWNRIDFSRFSLVNSPSGAEYHFGLLSHDNDAK
ncbi:MULTISPECIES: ABC transporter substrate-binding protein [Thalassospira]|uniref:ABC transporter substrate-binding protein n=1 Tax=Thalassospira aquimaris TaxID=3037796 RepID=A0ABT6GDT1_9PROT|nr:MULTISPECIES: ABC transporter substrate-binding protein [Thalassospira]MDG4720251.1 ABC transporter substrate-binding protein [Thalassospira sp. FZY0004]